MSDASPIQGDSLPLSLEEHFDAVCRRFEQAWQADQRPAIEPYLAEAPPEARAALLRELVALELAYRRRAGESPTVEEYCRRFPEHATLLEQVLADGDQPTRLAPPRTGGGPALAPAGGARYRPLRPHARGGLGEVQVAEDMELHREVALKRIQGRYAHAPESRRRFLREAEITGRLEHPGIVPVYGLVQDADGQPSYAMRFVQGQTLQEAIRRYHEAERPGRDPAERRLALRELLGRFVTICNTIAYAHSRGVLHRDLKPANIMLGKYGETLVVDWGLAKLFARTEAERATGEQALAPMSGPDTAPSPCPLPPGGRGQGEGAEALTWPGAVAGTPAYMSPEQAAGQWDRVGPASDIYSLGATLYEILVSRPPVEGATVEELLGRVRRGELVPPRQVRRGVPPALEAICLKAMALSPEDRYATATELAGDVERWLADEPVSVYRGTVAERLGRWARRHRTAVVGATVLGLAALLGFGLLAWQSERGRQRLEQEQAATNAARQQAEENARRERKVIRDYFVRTTQDPAWKAVGLEPLRKRLLQEAQMYFQEFIRRHGEEPELLAELAEAHARLGFITAELGDRKQACVELEAALALNQRLADAHPDDPQFVLRQAQTWNNLGEQRRNLGERAAARQALDDALELGKQLIAARPRDQEALEILALIHTNRGELFKDLGHTKEARHAQEQALALHQQLADTYPRVPDYRHRLAQSHVNLGVLLRSRVGDLADARTAYEKAQALQEQLIKEHPREPKYRWFLGMTLNDLAVVLSHLKEEAESLRVHQQALDIHQQLVKQHPAVPEYRRDLAMSYRSVGAGLRARGDHGGAQKAYEESLVIRERLVEEHGDVPAYRLDLARIYGSLGALKEDLKDYPGARQAFEKALELSKQLAADFRDVPEYRRELAASRNNLAKLLKKLDDQRAAQQHLEQARDLMEELVASDRHVPEYRRELAIYTGSLGDCLLRQGDRAGSRRAFERSAALWEELAAQHQEVVFYRQRLALTRGTLGGLLRDMGRWEEAADAYGQALPIFEKLADQFPRVTSHRRDLAGTHNNRGLVLKDLGRPDEAAAAYRQALTLLDQLAAEFTNEVGYTIDWSWTCCNLGQLVCDQGQPTAALEWYDKALRTLQPVLAGGGRRVEARGCLRHLYAGRAEALARLGRHEEAVKDLDEALVLAEAPRRPLLRARRALSLGAPADAVAAAQEHAKYRAISGATLYQCAHICALAAAVVKDDPRLHEQYAAGAVTLLQRAAAAGYPIDLATRKNQDLDLLRGREDFQKLLRQVEQREAPGAK